MRGTRTSRTLATCRKWIGVPLEQLTLWSAEAPARPSRLGGSERECWTREVASCSSTLELCATFARAGFSGRTSPECYRSRAEMLSTRSSGSWPNAGIRLHGELLTLNSSEWPSGADVCFLSDILENRGVFLWFCQVISLGSLPVFDNADAGPLGPAFFYSRQLVRLRKGPCPS